MPICSNQGGIDDWKISRKSKFREEFKTRRKWFGATAWRPEVRVEDIVYNDYSSYLWTVILDEAWQKGLSFGVFMNFAAAQAVDWQQSSSPEFFCWWIGNHQNCFSLLATRKEDLCPPNQTNLRAVSSWWRMREVGCTLRDDVFIFLSSRLGCNLR